MVAVVQVLEQMVPSVDPADGAEGCAQPFWQDLVDVLAILFHRMNCGAPLVLEEGDSGRLLLS